MLRAMALPGRPAIGGVHGALDSGFYTHQSLCLITVARLNRLALLGLQEALRIDSADPVALHVSGNQRRIDELRADWMDHPVSRPVPLIFEAPDVTGVAGAVRHAALELGRNRPVIVVVPRRIRTQWSERLFGDHTADRIRRSVQTIGPGVTVLSAGLDR